MTKMARIGALLAAGVISLGFFGAAPAHAAGPAPSCFLGVCWDSDGAPRTEYQPTADLCDWTISCKRDRSLCDPGFFTPCDRSDPQWNPKEQLAPHAKQRHASMDDCTLGEILLGKC